MALARALRRITGRRPAIVVRPVMGLANRLRAVTSCQALARHLGLELRVFWEGGKSFSDDAWHDLFANELPLLDRGQYERARLGDAIELGLWLGWGDDRPPHPSYRPERALEDIRRRGLVWDYGFHNVDKLLARRGAVGARKLRKLRHQACRALRPAPAIAGRVDAFAQEHFSGRRVHGVHIRRGDGLQGPQAESYLRSPDEAFAVEMQRRLEADPELRFFLATDCEKTLGAFRDRFPGRLLAVDKVFVESVFDAPKGGQDDAVLDLFLLSRTEEVLGTYASTFGRMGAHIGGVRYRVAGTDTTY